MASAVDATLRAALDSAVDAIVIFDDDDVFLDANAAVEQVLGVPRDELIGRRPEDYTPPGGAQRLAALRREFRDRRALRGEFEFLSPDGTPRWLEFSARADLTPGRHLAVMRDCTERRRTHDALEQRAAQQVAIADLGRLALGGLAPDELMNEVVSSVAATLAVESVGLVERLPDGRRLVRAGVGWRPGDAAVEEAESGVTVPVRGRGLPQATLEVRSVSPRRFGDHDVEFLRSVANTLAMAIERAHSDEELRRRSAEISRLAAERQRIVAEALDAEDRARERISQQLHDGLLQSLFVIRQDLAAAAAGPEPGELLARAREGILEAIRDLRAAVFDLHPVVLEQGGLRSAVSAVARHHAALGGFEVEVEVSRTAEGQHDRLILSLVRELLSNVARHGGARYATVRLRCSGGLLVLEVTDDGRGLDSAVARAAVGRGHIGLASAAQRIEALGGRFELLSRPGEGTTVRGSIPLAPVTRPR